MNSTANHAATVTLLLACASIAGLSACTASTKSGNGPGTDPAAGQVSAREADDEGTVIAFADAPDAVKTALLGLTGESSVTQVVRESDDGATTYDIEYTKDGVQWAVEISASGTVVENEVDDEQGEDDED